VSFVGGESFSRGTQFEFVKRIRLAPYRLTVQAGDIMLSTTQQSPERQQIASESFDAHEDRRDGTVVVSKINQGFSLLAKLAYSRVHGDVEKHLGVDSFYDPLSIAKSESRAKTEILAFAVGEAAHFAEERAYVRAGEQWCESWLAALLLDDKEVGGGIARRLEGYRDKSPDDRRRAFSLVLERAFPEAVRAPLVIYRLMPAAARLAIAQAFDRADHAQAQRDRQVVILPNILDCGTCHGAVLPIGQACAGCGNPFWKYELLTAAW
jgi:hypothetical protein